MAIRGLNYGNFPSTESASDVLILYLYIKNAWLPIIFCCAPYHQRLFIFTKNQSFEA